MALQNVGVPDIPNGPFDRQRFDIWLRNTVVALQQAILPPGTVSNMRATAVAGGVQVDFTRSDGDAYVLYWNTTPSINGATRIDLGTANQYVDDIGAGSVKRYYAVIAKKDRVSGSLSVWVSETSLALGTAITPPTPPPPTDAPFVDQETDSDAIQVIDGGETYSV